MLPTRRAVWIRTAVITGALAALGGASWGIVRLAHEGPRVVAPSVTLPGRAVESDAIDAGEAIEDDRAYAFHLPSGDAPALSCEEARRIVTQVRTTLAYEPEAVSSRAFASAVADWLDPHGLWSAAKDAPTAARLGKKSAQLLAEIEGRTQGDCPTARELGTELVRWVGELRGRFDRARASATADPAAAFDAIAFDATARPAMQLAAELGEHVGAFASASGDAASPYVEAARARYFPALDAEGWSHVVLAAAVRAYVPLIDPHGAWAPMDEEESVYEVDLAGRPPARLWEKSERTAVGLRLGEGAAPPLAPGDLLLTLAGVTTTGLPLEQLDQLSFAAAQPPEPVTAIVLRGADTQPKLLRIGEEETEREATAAQDDDLPLERIAYGSGDALVVAIHDVRDDLGAALTRTVNHARRSGERPALGVLLDLRGNGGGSTDGAIAALGLFLPGAPLFPMRRRDGTIETDRAPEPPPEERWNGPVASLVDGATASAAEMIAGALAVYHRGASVGAMTYGKGCAQEYVDDDAHAGVLRLTTLLYALPDGTPVQRVGIAPDVAIPFETNPDDIDPGEREATLSHAAPTWHGPDVRERRSPAAEETWSAVSGSNAVGPCRDADVCRALRALSAAGTARTAKKKK